jgi:hypothetical protein
MYYWGASWSFTNRFHCHFYYVLILFDSLPINPSWLLDKLKHEEGSESRRHGTRLGCHGKKLAALCWMVILDNS